jgi:hypothetical protein
MAKSVMAFEQRLSGSADIGIPCGGCQLSKGNID